MGLVHMRVVVRVRVCLMNKWQRLLGRGSATSSFFFPFPPPPPPPRKVHRLCLCKRHALLFFWYKVAQKRNVLLDCCRLSASPSSKSLLLEPVSQEMGNPPGRPGPMPSSPRPWPCELPTCCRVVECTRGGGSDTKGHQGLGSQETTSKPQARTPPTNNSPHLLMRG